METQISNKDEPIYSNKLHLSYLQFLERQFGKETLQQVLGEVGVDELTFADLNGYQPAAMGINLRAAAKKFTGRDDIAYLSGRSIKENIGSVVGFLVGITSPDLVIKNLAKLESRMALKTISTSKIVGRNKYHVETTFRDGFKEAPEACQNRIGTYEGVARFFGLPFAKVEHPQCAFRGDPHCIYIVTMPDSQFIIFRKLAYTFLFVFLFLFLFYFATKKPYLEILSIATATLSFISYAFFKHMTAKKSIEWNEYMNDGLMTQNFSLEKNNLQIQALQKLTNSLSQSVHVQEICDMMVQTLVGQFKYDSSQVWLLDGEGKWLKCQSAIGYKSEIQSLIMSAQFEMGKGWENPSGLLIQTLEEKKTLLVNEVDEAIVRLSAPTQAFLRRLNMSSFIITPLFDNDKPVGILSAENHSGKKLEHNDRLLFQSVSHTLSSAIVKAQLFQTMEEKIVQRTRDLEITSQKLLAAQEIAIQSEKLSSLGQMAAGVAHEINNPLNFLINIIPEVKRDMQGLEQIRNLILKSPLREDLKNELNTIENTFDLESHLEEKDFVFDKIKKALDKSARIANSLKVFSRSSNKDKIEEEFFAPMIKDVLELLPQMVRGDTEIEVNILPELKWHVNKNEIEQAFLALINNAIDAMQQKGKLVITGKEQNSEIVLSFQDNGPGIPEALIKRIFDPFYTTKPPGKGTGLGLSIAAEIIKKYGGSLSVQSRLGEGANFTLRFKKV